MRGCGGGAELQRVRQNAGQRGTFDVLGHAVCIGAHQVMHDGGGAGQRAHGDVDWAFGFQTADQFVVIDDRPDIGRVDGGRQLCRVVGVNDHNRCVGFNVGDDGGLLKAPALQHEGGFGVGFAQEDGGCRFAFHLVQIPSPDDGGAGGIGVGRFVAENLNGHEYDPV